MLAFGVICLILGVAILFNPALLGFFVGLFLLVMGCVVIFGWYKVNRVFEKSFQVGKYHIVFQKRETPKK